MLSAQFLDSPPREPEVMSRHPREQVVNKLELESTMEPIHPNGAVYVHRCPRLDSPKIICLFGIILLITDFHWKMAYAYLNMQNATNRVRQAQEGQPIMGN